LRVAFYQELWTDQAGPLLLAEILEQKGHEVRFVLAGKGWEKTMAEFSPHVAAFSVYTGSHLSQLAAARRVKETCSPAPLVVLGGPHPTFYPEVLKDPMVDAACAGEAETAFPAFLEAIESGSLEKGVENFAVKHQGRVIRRPMAPLVRDLDALPIPRREALYNHYPLLAKAPFMRICAGRGCPYSCSYCFNGAFRRMTRGLGPYIRRRSPENVLEEMAYLSREYGMKHAIFNDDVFTLDRGWLEAFAREKGRLARKVTYDISTCARFLSGEVVRLLAGSGCRMVCMGVEVADERFRQEVLKKPGTNREILDAAERLHAAGIGIQTYNMVGFPGQTLEQALDTVRLNREIRPFYAWCSIATPYPGTELSAYWARQYGSGETDLPQLANPSYFQASALPGEEAAAATNLQKFFALLVRFPFLEPLVLRLIKRPANRGFHAVYQAVYGLHMMRRLKAGPAYALALYRRLRGHF